MQKTALFPVSLSNKKFSSERAVASLPAIAKEYDLLLIWLVDKITIFNKALSYQNQGDLSQFFKKQNDCDLEYIHRKSWMVNVIKKLKTKENDINYKIIGTNDIVSTAYSEIYRKLIILHNFDNSFAFDIKKTIAKYFKLSNDKQLNKFQANLSIHYLLEEIALNLNLRHSKGVCSEYYLGQQLKPLLKLYFGMYSVTVDTLTGISSNAPYTFYEFSDDTNRWKEIEMTEAIE